MFQSISGYSSEQSIAYYSTRPTVSRLKGASDTTSDWFENHQPQRTQIFIVTNAPFIQNSNRMASRLTTTASLPSVFFHLLQFSRQRPNFSGHRQLWWQKLTWLFQYFQFSSAFAVSFHYRRSDFRVKFDSGVISLDQSQFFVTHSNQWDCCILYRQ